MKPIKILYADLYYIISAAKVQLKEWYKEFSLEPDRIEMQKCETILQEITESDSMDFAIIEEPF